VLRFTETADRITTIRCAWEDPCLPLMPCLSLVVRHVVSTVPTSKALAMQANTRLGRRSNVAEQQNTIQRKKKRLAESSQTKCDWSRIPLGDAPLTLWGTSLHLLQHSETTSEEFALSQLLNGVNNDRPTLWLHGKLFIQSPPGGVPRCQ
jgi:hypothetical protein